MQIDLIYMRQQPDGPYRCIAHHWSKYHVMFPLEHKSAVEVAHGLKNNVLAYFGLPRWLQLDDGHEFNNHVIASIVRVWPGNAKIVNGRPRHPQTHELVERGNRTIEAKLAYIFSKTPLEAWSE